MAAAVDIAYRKQLARLVLSSEVGPPELAAPGQPPVPTGMAELLGAQPAAELLAARVEPIPFPDGLAPRPQPLDPRPENSAALPKADVLVITWTVAEHMGMADVLTPGYGRAAYYPYTRNYRSKYESQIRQGAPARKVRRLGSWFLTRVGRVSAVCFKSELHLNQDSIPTGDGTATLPVKDLFRQLIEEVEPRVVLTIGTSGAVFLDHSLGDVVVTRAAKFRLQDEFRNEPFNAKVYRSRWDIPAGHFPAAVKLMARHRDRLVEPAFGPPTKRYPFDGAPIEPRANNPRIHREGHGGLKEFLPILTTDFFEFGTSKNNLEKQGIAVEMGDAVLGLAAAEMEAEGKKPPLWAVVRNLSDPQINGDLPAKPRELNMQAHWAVWYYETYGYWTSVNGGLATWAILAGL